MNRDEQRAAKREERRLERLAADGGTTDDAVEAIPMAASEPSSGAAAVVRERTAPTQFMREVRSELRKVAWPTRKEVVNYTVVVLVVTLVLTLITFGMDFVLRELMLQITA